MFGFVNRHSELALLRDIKGGLIVIHGRRRVGKTRLVKQWAKDANLVYSQAIEADASVQVEQLYSDIGHALSVQVRPKDWSELLELLKNARSPQILCVDEFPYLVASDATLPSRLQKWIDHDQPSGLTLVLLGSSQRMMHDIFLYDSAPLFGRARALVHVRPMDYRAFCQALKLDREKHDSFALFSLVGGIPKYWELINPGKSVLANAEDLFFSSLAYMENEPFRLLHDEGLSGSRPSSLLELIGRGVHRPSEMASKLQIPQTHLSRPLRQLVDLSLITRAIPFGESERDSKRSHYKIQDPALRFWFGTLSPHRSRWGSYSKADKEKLIHDHTSTVFEDAVRFTLGGQGYWDSTCEIDALALGKEKVLQVYECKWTKLTSKKKAEHLADLEKCFQNSKIAKSHAFAEFHVVDEGFLNRLTW